MTNILQQFDTVAFSEEGAWLYLCAPGTDEKVYTDNAKKKPLRIKLKGPDSDPWVSFQKKVLRRDKKAAQNVDDEFEDSKLLAKMTITWENLPVEAGECTYENALKLYINYKDIRRQVLHFVVNQENFTQRLPTD